MSLEQKVAYLTARLTVSVPRNFELLSTDAIKMEACNCQVANLELAKRNSILQQQTQVLHWELSKMKQSLNRVSDALISPIDSIPSPFLRENSVLTSPNRSGNRISDLVDSDNVISSEDLYGALDLGHVWSQLKAFDGLKDGVLVDELVDWALVISNCTNRTEVKKYLIQGMQLRHKFMDKCNPQDRKQILRIFERGKQDSMDHWRHWYRIAVTGVEFDNIPEIDSPYISNQLKAMLKVAEKLHRQRHLDENEGNRRQLFENTILIQGSLQVLCKTSDEREKTNIRNS
ncbi:hypothetical protein HK100_011144 [Physocladia obscura]|uniref:Uncharacterized protein n=1 Tax=Physocladia obscura TaxID=109957 RepID=A0AAD5XH67_9FUNG|nr:hypothetical protein HK100_011144 [Physocladia obscura]